MGGGTEAFPDLGHHCQHPDCKQLDFLPFTCAGCQQVFCLEHRSYKSHDCPKSDINSRKVLVCNICSMSIETTGCFGEDEKGLMERHQGSRDCDPRKKKKPTCPVRRCKQVLTFSNSSTCKTCNLKVCLKHRFPADHACKKVAPVSSSEAAEAAITRLNKSLMVSLGTRNGKDCAKNGGGRSSSPPTTPSVKAC